MRIGGYRFQVISFEDINIETFKPIRYFVTFKSGNRHAVVK